MKVTCDDLLAGLFVIAFVCLLMAVIVFSVWDNSAKRRHPEMRIMNITVDGVPLPPLPVLIDATNIQIEIK